MNHFLISKIKKTIPAIYLLVLFLIFIHHYSFGKETLLLSISNLKVEYAENPLSIDVEKPQFSWELSSKRKGIKQESYQILIADSKEMLDEKQANIWNSGKVISAKSVAVLYQGKKLESQKKYYWKVKIWEKSTGKVLESEIKEFSTALITQSDWQSDWVGFPFGWAGKVLYFRHEFQLPTGITSAKVHFAGIGYHELEINGKKVGKNVLDPATSDYAKRVYYSSFDIEDFLKENNVLIVTIAQGWYGVPKLRLQMEIKFNDGSIRKITSNDIRQVTTGPTVNSSILDGEVYDARLESNWYKPTDSLFSTLPNEKWGVAPIVEAPGGIMDAQHIEPIQVVEELKPIRIMEPSKGIYVFDVGQNLAGWANLKIKGEKGLTIKMKFAESIYDNGLINQENLRTAAATDTYIAKGNIAGEAWEPRFTYHGFRYVQIEGLPYKPNLDDITIKRVRSAVAANGNFTSSNELLNRIWLMVNRTEASNLHSIPTDCPQRDERMGWMNDITVRIEQAIYNFDMSRFYAKYLQDVADTQDELGRITCTAPYRYGGRPADPVSASYLLLALKSYEFYGNKELLAQHYDGFKAWVDFLNSWTKDGILEYSYYGDWSPPVEFGKEGVGYSAVSKNTPGNLVSTGFLYHSADLLTQMAKILGKDQDVVLYQELMKRTHTAFNNKFYDQNTGGYGSNNQACNSLAISFGLAEGDRKEKALQNIVIDVIERDNHLTTGNICTKYLLEVLTENGFIDVAYKIASQKTYPSWGYMLENGATTLWERWEHATGGSMNSHNHPMMGSVGSWLYKYLLGIKPEQQYAGFERFTIKPYFPENLQSCEGSYQSVKGEIKSAWKRNKNKISIAVTVPGNSTADLYLPITSLKNIRIGGANINKQKDIKFIKQEGTFNVFEVPSGEYEIESIISK